MNLFQQAMYRGKPQPQKNTVMTGDDIRNTMCKRGLTGVKATALVHSGKWKNHKYLYIDANGKYVYPEDVTNKAKSGINNAKEGVAKAVANQKQKIKDKKFVRETNKLKKRDVADEYDTYEEWNKAQNRHNAATDRGKYLNQIKSAHQKSVAGSAGGHLVSYWKGDHDTTEELERQKQKKKNRKSEQQQKSAHAGYERNKKIFPDGGSTEELEIQKEKTKARKQSKLNNKRRENLAEKRGVYKKRRETVEQQRKSAHAGYERDKKIFPDGGSTEELEIQKEKTANRKKAKIQQKSAHSQANKRYEGYKKYAVKYNKEHGTNYKPEDFYTPYSGLEIQLKKKRSAKRRRELTGQR